MNAQPEIEFWNGFYCHFIRSLCENEFLEECTYYLHMHKFE